MNGQAAKYELWGTFSVMDHLREGAFLAEVIMYDRLLIPVPPNPTCREPRGSQFCRKTAGTMGEAEVESEASARAVENFARHRDSRGVESAATYRLVGRI